MKKYLNQTTVNVVAIVRAVAWGACLAGNLLGVGQGTDKAMRQQLLMNRQLDYDIGRIKACGEMKRYGVEIDPRAPMHYLCADVILTNQGE